MEHETDRTNYEQEDPKHPTEGELLDRITDRIDEALRKTAEAEQRMTRNAKGDPKPR
jgi:hypothetical protein